jgi:hypothetical protein
VIAIKLHVLVGLLALACASAATSPRPAAVDEDSPSLEQLAIEMAQTPAEHRVIAEHFRSKAEQARAEARRHRLMSRIGGAPKMAGRPIRQSHCSKLAKQQMAIAEEYEALAKLHEEDAQRAE